MVEREAPELEVLAQHRWLQQLVGNWVCTVDVAMPDGQKPPPAIEKVRALGNTWIQGETQTEMPGMGQVTMQITLGFDPQKQRFVGTWVGSMMTHLWVYEGELDATGKVLTLNAEGPAMMGGGENRTAKYQDTISLIDPNERTLTSQQQQPDGSWQKFMTAHYKRKP